MAQFNLLEYLKNVGGKLGRGQKPQPPVGEMAVRKDDIYDSWQGFVGSVPRTDPVTTGELSKVSRNYQYEYGEYRDIVEKNAMVKAVLTQRYSAVLNRDRVWKAANKQETAVKAKALMEAVTDRFDLHSMDGGFNKDLYDLLQGVPYGIAVLEVIWGKSAFPIYNPDGEEIARQEWFVPLELKARDPRRFAFDPDERLMLRTSRNADGELQHPLKYIVFRPYNLYGDPYGTPGLRCIFWLNYFKKLCIRWWMVRNERLGDPPVYAKPTERPFEPEERDELKNVLMKLQTETAMVLPFGTDVGVIEGKLNSEFLDFVTWVDDQTSMAIIGQTMTTDTGEQGGSKGMSEVHERVAHSIQAMDARALESIVNSTLVPWTVYTNLGDVPLPQLEIVTEPPKNLLEIAEWVEKVIAWDGPQIPVGWVHETFGIDRATSEGETVKPRVEPTQMALPGQQPSQQRGNKTRAKQNERRRKKPGDGPRPQPKQP